MWGWWWMGGGEDGIMEEDDDEELEERAHVWPAFISCSDMVSDTFERQQNVGLEQCPFIQMGGTNLSNYELSYTGLNTLVSVGIATFQLILYFRSTVKYVLISPESISRPQTNLTLNCNISQTKAISRKRAFLIQIPGPFNCNHFQL